MSSKSIEIALPKFLSVFAINYRFSDAYSSYAGEVDEAALRYYMFCGDAVLTTGHESIALDWGWVPLLDLAWCLRDVGQDLRAQEEAAVDFTESAERLLFHRTGEALRITCTFSDQTLELPVAAFEAGVQAFYKAIVEEALHRHPSLQGNEHFCRYASAT